MNNFLKRQKLRQPFFLITKQIIGYNFAIEKLDQLTGVNAPIDDGKSMLEIKPMILLNEVHPKYAVILRHVLLQLENVDLFIPIFEVVL